MDYFTYPVLSERAFLVRIECLIGIAPVLQCKHDMCSVRLEKRL